MRPVIGFESGGGSRRMRPVIGSGDLSMVVDQEG